MMSNENAEPPVVRVVSGSPTPEELAAIVTVLSAAAGGDGNPDADFRSDRPRVGGWKSYTRTLRRAAFPGPGAWRHTEG